MSPVYTRPLIQIGIRIKPIHIRVSLIRIVQPTSGGELDWVRSGLAVSKHKALSVYMFVCVPRVKPVYSRTSLIRIEPDQTPSEYMKFPD